MTMRIILIAFALASMSCETEQEEAARRARYIANANKGNAHSWEWVDETMECKWSERRGFCLCVFQRHSGGGISGTSEMGLTFAPNRACGKAD
jgi:hypothetical protein